MNPRRLEWFKKNDIIRFPKLLIKPINYFPNLQKGKLASICRDNLYINILAWHN